ncbi:MAG: hypothetical protein SFY69_00775 [Planctomycetota bacterium]|nr:hypothetical protein [Planctomycetota bacterium]
MTPFTRACAAAMIASMAACARADVETTPLGLPRVTVAPDAAGAETPPASGASWVRVALACGTVVGLICLAGWGVRRVAARGGLVGALGPGGKSPSGVLEVLGRYPVARSCTLVLLKLDSRVLLLSHTAGRSGAGMQTLCEIADPEQVASILLKTRDDEGSTLARKFQEVLTREHGTFDRAAGQASRPAQPLAPARQAAAAPARASAAPVRPAKADAIKARLDALRARPKIEVRA